MSRTLHTGVIRGSLILLDVRKLHQQAVTSNSLHIRISRASILSPFAGWTMWMPRPKFRNCWGKTRINNLTLRRPVYIAFLVFRRVLFTSSAFRSWDQCGKRYSNNSIECIFDLIWLYIQISTLLGTGRENRVFRFCTSCDDLVMIDNRHYEIHEVLFSFWPTWCAECRKRINNLELSM